MGLLIDALEGSAHVIRRFGPQHVLGTVITCIVRAARYQICGYSI